MHRKNWFMLSVFLAAAMVMSPLAAMAAETEDDGIVMEEEPMAVDEQGSYHVRYQVTDADGMTVAEFEKDALEGEDTPVYSGQLYLSENQVFMGWSPEVAELVTGDAVYEATWEEADPDAVHTFSVAFAGSSGEDETVTEAGGTFDVWINGEQLLDDVESCKLVLYEGTQYRVDDIKPMDGLVRADDNENSGTLGEDVTLSIPVVPEGTEVETNVPDSETESPETEGSEIDSTEATVTYTITFDAMDGTEPTVMVVNEGEEVEMPEPVREGFTFQGWYNSDEGGDRVGAMIGYTDMNLYAHWIGNEEPAEIETPTETPEQTFTVSFDSNGGVPVEAIMAQANESILLPETTREGYVFQGWYTSINGGEKVESWIATEDAKFYAHWMEEAASQFMVTFDSQGGNEVESIVAAEGETITLPVATWEGHVFLGWFDAADGGSLIESLRVTGDVTLYAHWQEEAGTEAVTSFTITYKDGADGSAFADVVYKAEKDAKTPAYSSDGSDPVREGYLFDKWEPEVAETVIGDAVYTATWKDANKVGVDENEEAESESGIANTGKTDSVADSVKTGDMNIALFFGIGIAALAILCGAFVYLRKTKR